MENNKHGLAIASLVLGIISAVLACCYGLGFFTGIVGIVLAAVAKKSGNKEGMTTAGLVLSIIAVALNIVSFILIVVLGVVSGIGSAVGM